MRITLSSYFHIGFAIGTNDIVFHDIDNKLKLNNGMRIIPRHNKQLCVRLGDGITIDISNTDMFKDLKDGAYALIQDEKYHDEFGISPNLVDSIKKITQQDIKISCVLGVYSCGIATFEIIIDSVSDNSDTEAFFRFAQMFEYSSYGDYSSNTNFQPELLNKAKSILDTFNKDDNLKSITTIDIKENDSEFKYNFFPSFTILFNTSSQDSLDRMLSFRNSNDDGFICSTVNGKMVYTSWYTLLIGHDGKDTIIADLVRTYNLFYGACEMMENVMNNVIYNLLNPDKEGDKLKLLIKLQLTGNLIINNTTIHSLTQNQELMAVFYKINSNGDLENFYESINRSLNVCTEINRQFNHELEKEEEADDKLRDDRINFFVILFTSLTFVSVAADFLSLNEQTSLVIPNIGLRILVYSGALAVFILIISYLFFKKKKNK